MIRHPADPGAKSPEGEEFEGELSDGERVWLDQMEEAGVWAEEADILALEAVKDGGSENGEALAEVPDPEAVVQAKRFAKLKETLAELRHLGAPAAANLVNEHILRVDKSARCGGRGGQVRSQGILRAFVRMGSGRRKETGAI